MKTYEIIDDSGVDYNFLREDKNKRPWVGQIVKGSDVRERPYKCVTIEKPYGLPGTYTASPEAFREILDEDYYANTEIT
jgi:hypothetical protein